MSDLHILLTESGDYGWTIESPQIPELIGGRTTSDEIVADTADIIEWAKDPDQAFEEVYAHEQHLVRTPDGLEFLIRFQFNRGDDDYEARYDTAGRLNFAIENGLVEAEEYGQHPVLSTTGERLYIAVRASDTLGWIHDQLSDRYECCVLAQHLGDGAVANLPFGNTGTLRNGIDTDALGLTRESTFSEMLDAVLTREAASLRQTTHLPPKASSVFTRHIESRLLTTT